MDDNHEDNGLPLGRSKQSLSEAHPAESMNAETTGGARTQAMTIPSNGSSQRKIEANRRNAEKSTGPKTPVGKTISSWNSLKHGLVAKRLVAVDQQDAKEFSDSLAALRQDLKPVGALEELLVEKIAHEYWKTAKSAKYDREDVYDAYLLAPTGGNLLRYLAMINRQLFQAMNQFERLQRLRRDDNVAAESNFENPGDTTGAGQDENPGQKGRDFVK